MLLGFLTSILCIDAVLVVACRLRMNISLAFVRSVEAMVLITTVLHTTSWMQIGWTIMASLVFLYNTWFVFADDDALSEGGAVGRWLIDHTIRKMEALESHTVGK
jgi:hypothetical protein